MLVADSRKRGPQVLWGALLALVGCTSEAEPRPQLLLVIDTDAPVVEQLVDPSLSPAAALDTLRIEALDAEGAVFDWRTLLVPAVSDWPVSLGCVISSGDQMRFRIRAFRGMFATPGSLTGDADPIAEITIDRLVELSPATDAIRVAHVRLATACMGIPTTLDGPGSTCVDEDQLAVDPQQGIDYADSVDTVSEVGTWPGAREVPCQGSGPGRCIAGGFAVLGDTTLADLTDPLVLPPVPLRPVLLSPFWMDETEFTVGHYQDLLDQDLIYRTPFPYDPNSSLQDECSWNRPGVDPATPLNCITLQAAEEACAAEGGSLPSEAEWEYAARGRGRGWRSPWGDEVAACCSASIAQGSICPYVGLEPVGSHRPSAQCPIADESPEGMVDLAGSLMELVADAWEPYDSPCWSTLGIPRDPVCVETGGVAGCRGGSFLAGFIQVQSAFRSRAFVGQGVADEQVGFRCVYPDW